MLATIKMCDKLSTCNFNLEWRIFTGIKTISLILHDVNNFILDRISIDQPEETMVITINIRKFAVKK